MTTFIATSLVTGARRGSSAPGSADRSTRAVPITLAIVVAMLLLTAALPLTEGARPVLAPDVFDPDTSFPIAPSSGGTSPSDGPTPSSLGDPTSVERGQAVPITLDGQPVGTITVVDWSRAPVGAGSDLDRLTVNIAYKATATFPLDVGIWSLVLDDGTDAQLELLGGASTLATPLAAGDFETLTFEADVPTTMTQPVLVYVDQPSGEPIMAIVLD